MANKFLSAIVTVAAIGGVCYAFRDKIKESKVYQSLDVEDKVEKVKTTIKEKMPTKDDAERDYFTLNEEDVVTTDATEAEEGTETASADDSAASEVLEEAIATDISESASDVSAMVDDLLSDIPEIQIAEEDVKKEESPIIYENEGLSDSSEDLDVIEEQDKLDI